MLRKQEDVNELARRSGIQFVAKAMERQYRRSQINVAVQTELASIDLYRSVYCIYH